MDATGGRLPLVTGGELPKEFMALDEIDRWNENEIYVGEISNWRV
jgi:hypothetical protein